MKPAVFACYFLLLYGGWATTAQAQVFDERFDAWPLETKIQGRLIVAGPLKTLEPIQALLPDSVKGGRLLLLCSSQQREALTTKYEELAEQVSWVGSSNEAFESWAAEPGTGEDTNEKRGFEALAWHNQDQNFEPSSQSLLQAVVSSGKTAIVVGAPECCGKLFPRPAENATAIAGEMMAGANVLLDSVLTLSDSSPESRQRMLEVLQENPRVVGIELADQTALLLAGRKCLVAGNTATFVLPECDWLPARVETLEVRQARSLVRRRQKTTDWLMDLTEWRRDAIDRDLEQFPPAEPRVPYVENGTLFIVGGGGLPENLMQDFIDAAGGIDKAKLVYVPCSEAEEVSPRRSIVETWKRMGVQQATLLHTKDRTKANEDEDFFGPLRDATGIWFGGGRQWNFADSYYGTETHRLMKEVLKRGGAVGGSSAGASIQARYLARATPIENFRIMAPGYERGGLGFLSGVAIDQHFSQRGRQKDMKQLVDRYPQLLGIGIDETTAIVVRKSLAEVRGEGRVFFYDRSRSAASEADDDTIALEAGSIFDLAERQVLSDRSTD